jgi:hypothetical protein
MFPSLIGWPLLLVQFFLIPFWREQVLALQTLICAMVKPQQSYHTATAVVLFVHLSKTLSDEWVNQILHHIIVAAAVLLEYFVQDYRLVGWVCAAWSVHWLGAAQIQPIRSCLRYVVFLIVANARKRWADNNYYKTVWILLVHEVTWCIIPVQMLYEIYFQSIKKTLVVTV